MTGSLPSLKAKTIPPHPDDSGCPLSVSIVSKFLIVVGIGLITAFLSFGIYYDEDSFLISAFGKRNRTYRFAEIRGQQLYNANGNIVIELHMIDETAIQLHSFMEGTDTFLNAAFYAWCRQKNIDPDACGFYDPGNSCWFPNAEG